MNTAPLYRLPFGTLFSYTITTPIIGIAQGAYDAHVETMRERVRISYGGQKVAQDPFAHVRVARAASDIDAAWLQLVRNVREQSPLRRRRPGPADGAAPARPARPGARHRCAPPTPSTCSSRTPAAAR